MKHEGKARMPAKEQTKPAALRRQNADASAEANAVTRMPAKEQTKPAAPRRQNADAIAKS
jgi:hypothetical protein